MLKKVILLLFILFMLLFYSGCMNLMIKTDVDYPAGLFSSTMKKIEKIHAKDPHRKGTVSNLNFLVYVGDERKLISFSVPKGILQKTMECDFAKELDIEDVSKRVGRVNWKKLKSIDQLGPGLILEAEVEEDDVHLLIWLD